MTRREHYLAAERLLGLAGEDHEVQIEILTQAQVHATLATVAASIERDEDLS